MKDIPGKSGFFQKMLNRVERLGNRLPHPVSLFLLFIAGVLLLSWIVGSLGVGVTHPASGERIQAVNLLTKSGIQRMLTSLVEVFTDFPPLGLVLVVMLGIGVAERTGLIGVALRVFVSKVPPVLITFSLIVAGMLSSIAADAGYVILIPLGAAIFHGLGRHPIAGLCAAFAGVSGSYSANLLPTSLDPLIASFSQPAAQIIDSTYTVNPLSNYFLMVVLVPVVGIAGTWVTEKIVVPRLGPYQGIAAPEQEKPVSHKEKRALKWTLLAVVVMLAGIALLVIPENAILRDKDGGFAPFYHAIVALMFIVFFLSGLIFGMLTHTIRNDKDAANMTADTMNTMGAYIVLAFVAAQFVAYFNWSNLGLIVAVSGAEGLQSIGLKGIPLLLLFIVVSSLINLLIGSASAKWAIMAPVFVPMLMLMGYAPELTQAAYRIGDSFTNILTPLLPYFPLIIISAQKYDKKIGLGTIIANMLPYSIAFAIVMTLTLVVWILLGIPLGFEGAVYYQP